MPIADAYRDDLAYIHDVGYGAVANDAAVRVIDELAGVGHYGLPVVDLGCGSGILAQALTEAGRRVVGVDVSEAMVARAQARAPRAEFRVGSFVSSDLPPCVAVTAIGEVLSYTFDAANDDTARAGVFRRIFEALVPGGVLLFDIAGPERARPAGPHRTFATGPDWAVLVETDLDTATGLLTRSITTFRQVGPLYRRDSELHRLVLLDPAAVLESLRVIGFETQIFPMYRTVDLPPGVVAFLARKPVVDAHGQTAEAARARALPGARRVGS
jgi:SAM-dependent methyltransferase